LLLLLVWPLHITAGQPNGLHFTDITAPAGITFKHVASPDKKYIVESMSGGVALFDYDADGYLDIYFVNSLTVDMVKAKTKTRSALYHNNGDGTFTDVTDKAGVGDVGWGMGVAVGDYNNDGFADLYVTCLGQNHLFKNNGNGTFTDVTDRAGVGDPRWSTGAAFVDYDKDGKLDLFVSNYVNFDINHLPEFGQGRLCQYKGVPVQCGPRGLPGAGDALYHNNGDGTFKEIGFTSGTAVNDNGSEQGSMGVTVGDYDHDGRFDLFVTNFADEYNTLYHNDGHGSFTDVSYAAKLAAASLPYVGWGTKFFDFDNDGWVDLFVANGHVYPQMQNYRQRSLLYKNNRDGTFTEVAAQSGAPVTEQRVGRGVAFGDIDNDGDVDLVINDLDAPPQLLRNDGGNTNNAVLIKTVGSKSNRDGIGARVKIVAGDLTQIDEVRSGGSYISQSDLRLHFGLEKRPKIDLIEVRWPSGVIDKLTDAGVNKILTIKEGQGLSAQKDFNTTVRR
jgi:hypothetical protein